YPTPIAQRREYVPVFMAVCLLTFAFYLVVLHSLQKTQKIVEQNIQLQQEQKIYHIAYTDALTGLGNRAAYLERINQLERLRKNGISICCIELDMNGLKQVNDTLGHAAGDRALREIASALKTVFLCRQPDSVFRVGGDEFCVLLSDVDKAEATACLNQLKNQLKQSSQTLGFSLAAAAGVAWVQAEESIEATMIRADDQMYKNKRGEQHVSETEIETITS
ncbi:GGDEF domain-containing protein, partial [Holdemania massiliensis]